MNIRDFVRPDWVQIWAGDWSLLSCSQFGEQYTKILIVNGQIFMTQTIIFIQDGKSSCFMTQSDKDIFGKNLAQEVLNNPGRIHKIAANFRRQVDLTMDFMQKHQSGEITPDIYAAFWDRILEYYKPHVNVKYIVDYLDPARLKECLPILEEARIYAEPVFKQSEEFMRHWAEQEANKVGYASELLLCLLKDELPAYWQNKELPDQELLQQRHNKSALLVDASQQLLLVGADSEQAVAIIHGVSDTTNLKGSSAFPGKVQGTVRIILDPAKANHFQERDILVTGMTRPEYLPIMQKAAAIITDAGGILSHAAITARELKKPCVIGTNKATQVLKDGDEVEVNADQGVVKILKRAE